MLPGNVTAGIAKGLQAFDDFFNVSGPTATFTLKNGETVTLQVGETWKAQENMTDGLSQEIHRCRFLIKNWTASRPPEKGDKVNIKGRNFGIMEMHTVHFPDPVVYVVTLTG
jgi:hypothetical protein